MESSGRGVRHKKQTVEEAQQLSLTMLRRHGIVTAQWGGAWLLSWSDSVGRTVGSIGVRLWRDAPDQAGLRLQYTVTKTWTGEKIDVDDVVRITATPCHFGGSRQWFLCPGSGCGRRVAELYRPLDAIHYFCRHCHHLSYVGRQQHRDGAYESFGRFGAYRRRLEGARTLRQKARWLLRLYEADERIKAYNKAYDERFWKRLDRLKRIDDSKVTR